MLRRLHPEQPESFAFTDANMAWAQEQIKKYPDGRQASAVIPLLWRAQEQEGWLSKPALESVADMLDMAYIRVLEVATFYFMFQLKPVGSVAHIQICGTTSCMLLGSEDLIAVCKKEINEQPYLPSEDGKLSWEEVECLGACTNAPMAQIGKDYYEDLTEDNLRDLLAGFARGEVPKPGPQNGRFAAEPLGGPTSLKTLSGEAENGSVALATAFGDTVKRIDGSEGPIWTAPVPVGQQKNTLEPAVKKPAPKKAKSPAKDEKPPSDEEKPDLLSAPRGGQPDDLKKIKGVGPKLEKELNVAGVFHFDQIAGWSVAEVTWADQHLVSFKGRVSRDNWVGQAKELQSKTEKQTHTEEKKP
ncbi:MAG: NADH-quinone oxidoreductase subunit NuoE [Rhodobacteraceae bacterium]|nr:NADH-quinone oxidoreductase subunit NuoE [Paracoccaceae bacterium]